MPPLVREMHCFLGFVTFKETILINPVVLALFKFPRRARVAKPMCASALIVSHTQFNRPCLGIYIVIILYLTWVAIDYGPSKMWDDDNEKKANAHA